MAAKANFDLDQMSVPELVTLRDTAEAKRREKLESAKEAVLAETTAKLAELGLTLEEVLPGRPAASPGRKGRKDVGVPVAAKFCGPNGEEWSGRGRLPKWLRAMEAEGKTRDQFRI